MDLVAEIESALKTGLYITYSLAIILLYMIFLYYVNHILGIPIGPTLAKLIKGGEEPLTLGEEEGAWACGALITAWWLSLYLLSLRHSTTSRTPSWASWRLCLGSWSGWVCSIRLLWAS